MSDIEEFSSSNENLQEPLLNSSSLKDNISSNISNIGDVNDIVSDESKEIITEPIKNNTSDSEILAGGSEFETEDNTNIPVSEHTEDDMSKNASINEEQEGGTVSTLIEYKINYLVPDDEQLVNYEKIKFAVKRYIDNYNSNAMNKYKQLFKTVYQKYSSKRYLIENTNTEIIVSKSIDGAHKTGKRDIVFKILKPEYIFYNKDDNLIQMKSIISNKRNELQLHYQSLVNKLEVQPEEKKEFEKARKKFIDLLERYYIYNLYHNQINQISLEGKSNIIVQELRGFLKDNAEKKFALDGNLYTIDNSLVERINANNSDRLNLYNELIVKLQGAKSILSTSSSITQTSNSTHTSSDKTSKDKTKRDKIIDEIKEYLKSNDENVKLNNEIKDIARVQNTYVDYIISKLPNN